MDWSRSCHVRDSRSLGRDSCDHRGGRGVVVLLWAVVLSNLYSLSVLGQCRLGEGFFKFAKNWFMSGNSQKHGSMASHTVC